MSLNITVGGSSGGGPLAVKKHSPTSMASYSRSSSSFEDVDATNLLVTFTVPESGNVLVKCSALGNAGGQPMRWNLREGGSDLPGTVCYMGDANIGSRYESSVLISGLTPGQIKTYKWGYRAAGSTVNIYAGGPGDDTDVGPAIMEVWSA